MADNAELAGLRDFVHDIASGQAIALALIANALVKQGVLDRDDFIDDLNRAQNIYRSTDLAGALCCVLTDVANYLPRMSEVWKRPAKRLRRSSRRAAVCALSNAPSGRNSLR